MSIGIRDWVIITAHLDGLHPGEIAARFGFKDAEFVISALQRLESEIKREAVRRSRWAGHGRQPA